VAAAFATLVAVSPDLSHGATAVAVSLPDLVPIVQAVGGDMVQPYSIAPPGGDPHSFSPAAVDIRRLKQASLVVYANSSFLAFEARLSDASEGIPSVDWPDHRRHGARLASHPGMDPNPHGFWLDHRNAKAIAAAVAEALGSIGLPSDTVTADLRRFIADVDSAHADGLVLAERAGIAGDTFLLAVPGVAYAVENVGAVAGESLLHEGAGFVSGAALSRIVRKLESGSAGRIVCPVSMMNAKPGLVSRQLADETGSRVVYVQFVSGGDSYLAQARYNAEALTATPSDAADGGADPEPTTWRLVALGALLALAIAALMLRQRRTPSSEEDRE